MMVPRLNWDLFGDAVFYFPLPTRKNQSSAPRRGGPTNPWTPQYNKQKSREDSISETRMNDLNAVSVNADWQFLQNQEDVNILAQNFLESGHRGIGVNTLHSSEEHEVKHADMFCVTDWLGQGEMSTFPLKHSSSGSRMFLIFRPPPFMLLKRQKYW
ncbi:hypothetical protein RRG08_032768 [Elysia crispata]|uniref:Uncharacterized protein n=1 Tax=Elysia crispata TaxID=231223 RepID=A0AAE0YQ73_9GAST|nr:hypothetical protein RRG08_032768 [Elysia crispata]